MTDLRNFSIIAAAPDEFSTEEQALFGALVRMGSEVATNVLEANIRAAKVLVFGRVKDEVQGIAALKCPQASYRQRINREAGVEIPQVSYPYELGYVFLLPHAQGKKLSHPLVAAALRYRGRRGVFATVRTDNAPMLATLARAGFEPRGHDYPGREARLIRLLIKSDE